MLRPVRLAAQDATLSRWRSRVRIPHGSPEIEFKTASMEAVFCYPRRRPQQFPQQFSHGAVLLAPRARHFAHVKGKRSSLTNLEKPAAGRRSNNEGTYIDRGNGSWSYRRQFRGKPIEKQAKADTEAKAKRLAKKKVEDAIKLLEAGINPSAANITLGAYAQRWLEEDMQPRYDRTAISTAASRRRPSPTTLAMYAASRSTSAMSVWVSWASPRSPAFAVVWSSRERRLRTSARRWCG